MNTTQRTDMHWYEFEALVCELSGLNMMLPDEPEVTQLSNQLRELSKKIREEGKFSKESQEEAWKIQRSIKPEHVAKANELYHQDI